MKNMTRWMVASASLVLALGCEKKSEEEATETESLALATAALEESESGDEDGAMAALAFPEDGEAAASVTGDAVATLPATAQERLTNLKAYVKGHLACAKTVDSDGGTKITFGAACNWNGKRWQGDVTIVYTDTTTATVTLAGIAVDGRATITGSYTVSRPSEGLLDVKGERTTVLPKGSITTTLDAHYKWDDEAMEVPSAKRTRTFAGETAEMTTTDLRWLRSETSPESGTIVWKTRAGATITATFSREEATGELVVGIVSPRGSKTFTAGELSAK